ncbi:trypsin-like cysteine/serine peptidase domain-containing protein [Cladochytrium replicatum]|nr:trypsin-like cysteine/serine peptidase domain-containing protein [Cladochytrium replicatum]
MRTSGNIALLISFVLTLAASTFASRFNHGQPARQHNPYRHVNPYYRPHGASLRPSGIVNGRNASEGDFPYLACILERGNEKAGCICTGSFITTTHVLTAAHCVVDGKNISTNFVIVQNSLVGGMIQAIDNKKAIYFDTTDVYVPTDYTGMGQHDIAIIGVALRKDEDTRQRIHTVAVPTDPALCAIPATHGIATGFGLVEDRAEDPNSDKDTLHYAQLTTMATSECIAIYRQRGWTASELPFAQYTFCTEVKRKGDPDVCNGDSGGPFLVADHAGTPFVIGLVSGSASIGEKGLACSEAGNPNIWTCVPAYAEWITNVLSL